MLDLNYYLSAMLKSIEVTNYKAFHEKTKFDISNINILLWKNSVWKSSILEIFQLLIQTLHSEYKKESDDSCLILNWKTLKLWKNNDFIFSSWIIKEKEFSIKLSIESNLFENFTRSFFRTLELRLSRWSIWFENKSNRKLKTDRRSLRDNINLTKIIKQLHEKSIQTSLKIDKTELDINQEFIELLKAWKFLNNFTEKSKLLNIELNFKRTNKNIIIKSFIIKIKDKELIKIWLKENAYKIIWKTSAFQWIDIKFNSILPTLKDERRMHYLSYSFDKSWVLRTFLDWLWEEIKSIFNPRNIFNITPLRAYPQRHYLLDEFYNFSSDLWESLVQELEKENVQSFANKWFSKFWLEIHTEWKDNSVLKSLKVQQYWWNRDIVDVWFWISQVLPIIVQAMIVPDWSILLIQQPEIHLHPSMQSKLADLFIDIVNQKKLYLIIETHSEYLLNRLKLKLIQTKNNTIEDWKITKDKINIYFFEEAKNNLWTKVRPVTITDYWSFNFPKWFKDEQLEDTFLYMQELLKIKR